MVDNDKVLFAASIRMTEVSSLPIRNCFAKKQNEDGKSISWWNRIPKILNKGNLA